MSATDAHFSYKNEYQKERETKLKKKRDSSKNKIWACSWLFVRLLGGEWGICESYFFTFWLVTAPVHLADLPAFSSNLPPPKQRGLHHNAQGSSLSRGGQGSSCLRRRTAEGVCCGQIRTSACIRELSNRRIHPFIFKKISVTLFLNSGTPHHNDNKHNSSSSKQGAWQSTTRVSSQSLASRALCSHARVTRWSRESSTQQGCSLTRGSGDFRYSTCFCEAGRAQQPDRTFALREAWRGSSTSGIRGGE